MTCLKKLWWGGRKNSWHAMLSSPRARARQASILYHPFDPVHHIKAWLSIMYVPNFNFHFTLKSSVQKEAMQAKKKKITMASANNV